jgi:hypothetical protein
MSIRNRDNFEAAFDVGCILSLADSRRVGMRLKDVRDSNLTARSSEDDAEKAIRMYRYSEGDFDFYISETGRTPAGGGLFHIHSRLKVVHRASNVARSYEAGEQTSWSFAFEVDLKDGAFK